VHNLTVKAADAAGNVSGASAALAITLDTTAPAAPQIALTHDTGVSATDHITRDPTLSITPAESAGTLLYKADGAPGFSTTATTFSIDGSADGAHTVQIEQQDAAGNIGAATSFSFILDTKEPHLNGITASPASGDLSAGSIETFVLAFNEVVRVTGGTPTLTLNNGGTARYDAAATAALHDATKLAFDYSVFSSDSMTSSLAVTGLVAHDATLDDLAGNHANTTGVAAEFSGLSVNAIPNSVFHSFGYTIAEHVVGQEAANAAIYASSFHLI
jgi:hypothetical protein